MVRQFNCFRFDIGQEQSSESTLYKHLNYFRQDIYFAMHYHLKYEWKNKFK